MTTVRFQIDHLVGYDVEGVDEPAILARLDEPDLAEALLGGEPLEGALVFEGGDGATSVLHDELSSAVQRLCFEAVEPLAEPGGAFPYPYFNANNAAALRATDGTIAISGDDLEPSAHPRDELLRALYACGVRYLELLEALGDKGRAYSAVELAHLRPFAARAETFLRARGLL